MLKLWAECTEEPVIRHHLLLAALMVSPAAILAPGVRAQSSAPLAAVKAGQPSVSSVAAVPVGASKAAPPADTLDPAPQVLPLAPSLKGNRPKSNPNVLTPAATTLPPDLQRLAAPATLALPDRTSQVRIRELRPLGLAEVETLAEVNNPNLKALASQVGQAQSNLRAQIALWYPQLNLRANALPTYTGGQQYSSGFTGTGQQVGNTVSSIWRMQVDLEASWALINPSRTPTIAAARDQFEQAKNKYLIGLRDLRLQADKLYFALQDADEQVRIGQESVRSSQVSLRDARARFQAGVDTKLAVLQAETQLARDQQLLTNSLAQQAIARRTLSQLLNLPQDITPTAKDASRVLGTWMPSLQESIVAAYAFREELDQALLDISVANSNANTALSQVQPFLNIVNTLSSGRSNGYEFVQQPIPGETAWNVDNRIQGQLDVELNETGRWQARQAALALCDEPLNAIYASDLARAFVTATAIGDTGDTGSATESSENTSTTDNGEPGSTPTGPKKRRRGSRGGKGRKKPNRPAGVDADGDAADDVDDDDDGGDDDAVDTGVSLDSHPELPERIDRKSVV